LAVDSHHHRVAVRLGIIPETVSVGPAHAILEALLPQDWTAQQVYDHHEVMLLHGQKCCYYRNPECDRCPLLNKCPSGKTRTQS
jgi:endonuclease-3